METKICFVFLCLRFICVIRRSLIPQCDTASKVIELLEAPN